MSQFPIGSRATEAMRLSKRQAASAGLYGMMAQFESAEALTRGAEVVRDAGYKKFDVYSPFPIHGMDDAMGLSRSMLGWIVLCGGISGVFTGIGLQWYAALYEYPLITAGKPLTGFAAFIPFVPVTFELMVLFSAFAAVGGMILLNGLPAWYHPTLKRESFARATDDGFFLVIEAADPRFDVDVTKRLLEDHGGRGIELLED
ncbi:DUF3341 domain-containing protein [soil metagenome]